MEAIRQRADLVECVGRYVTLKKVGRNFVGCCPFHAETSPSFSVSSTKGFFHCFGCKASGDIFEFLMKMDGKSFPEVLEDLAARTGVELPERHPGIARAREQNLKLLDLNELAAVFFETTLWSSAGRRAAEYLAYRELPEEVARRFRLGYAPNDWRALTEHLRRKGADLQDAAALGLIVEGPKGPYDLFRDRVIFPILGLDGKVHGFGARAIAKDDQPKYINSRQSPVYDKSEILYGLEQARRAIQTRGEVVLVEGYFDVLSVVARGVDPVVAASGTALTESHARILKRYNPKKVVTVFDGDPAGFAASYRSAETLLQADLAPYMVVLPAKEDPDTFVRQHGKEAFEQAISSAKPSIEVLARALLQQNGNDVESRTAALKKLIPVLSACRDSLRQGFYITLVADSFGMPETELRRILREEVYRDRTDRKAKDGKIAEAPPARPERVDKAASPAKPYPIEEMLLALLLKYPDWKTQTVQSGVVDLLESAPVREVLDALLRTEATVGDSAGWLSALQDPTLRSRVSEKVMDDRALPPEKARAMVEECLGRIRDHHFQDEIRKLTERIRDADREGRSQDKAALFNSKIHLEKERKAHQ